MFTTNRKGKSNDMAQDDEYQQKQYNNLVMVPEHGAFFQRWKADSERMRATGKFIPDLKYGAATDEKLDLFQAAECDNGPLLVFIHGGWWRRHVKEDFSFIASAYTQMGINVAITDYTLAPAASVEEITKQQIRALAWLYRNSSRYGIDPERIVVAGHSAGGQLAAMLLATCWPDVSEELPENLLKGAVLMSGLYDLLPLCEVDFLNVDLMLTPENVGSISPAKLAQKNIAPFITALGAEESDAFHHQTRLIEAHWQSQLHASLDLPGVHHFSICDDLATPGRPLFEAAVALIKGLDQKST
jgi:arylformamidase